MKKRVLLFTMAVLLVFSVWGCTKGSGTTPDGSISITLSKTTASISRGTTLQLEAELTGADEDEIIWSSSDNTVASVNWRGLVTAITEGEAVITAAIDDVKASCSITVTAKDLSEYTEISNKEEFLAISENMSGEYVLTADIDWGGESIADASFVRQIDKENNTFSGVLDGNGYKIYNAYLETRWNGGLFLQVDGTVENLGIYFNTFNTGSDSGAVCFRVLTGGVISNVTVYADEIINNGFNRYAGLIAAYNSGGIIRNCVAMGNWSDSSSSEYVGYFIPIAANQGGEYINNNAIINKAPQSIHTDIPSTVTLRPQYSGIVIEKGGTLSLSNYAISGYTLTFSLEGEAAELNGTTVKGAEVGLSALIISIKEITTADGNSAFIKIPIEVVPEAGSLAAPNNIEISGADITWDSVVGAAGYRVSVALDGGDAQIFDVVGNSTTTARIADIVAEKGSGSYSVSVASVSPGAEALAGDYSAALTSNIFKVTNKTELLEINNGLTDSYILTEDIDWGGDLIRNSLLNSEKSDFGGTLDGNGKKIYNFTTDNAWNSGLFYDISGTVKNLSMICDIFNTGSQSGILAFRLKKEDNSSALIDNVYVYADNIINNGNAQPNGLIAAYNTSGTISNCVVSGNWTSGEENLEMFKHIAAQQSGGQFLNNSSFINYLPDGTLPSANTTLIAPKFAEINVAENSDVSISGYIISGRTINYEVVDTDIATISGSTISGIDEGATKLIISVSGLKANNQNAFVKISLTVVDQSKLLSPHNIKAEGTALTWDSAANAAKYKVEVLESGSDTPTVFDDITDTFCDISSVYIGSGEKTYTIKVWSVNSSGELSEQSSDIEYSVTLLSDWVGLHNLMKNEQPAGAVLSKHYVLTADIDCGGFGNKSNNVPDLWMTAGQSTFKGVFDGNGYEIYNFNVGSAWNTGLFRTVEGTVKNLTMHCGTYSQSIQGGILAYQITNGGLVENVYINVDRIDNKGTYTNSGGGFNGALANTWGSAASWGIIAFEAKGGTIKDCVASGNFDNTSALALKDLGAVNADIDGANFKGFAAGGTQTGNTLIININKGGSSSLGGTVAGVTSIFVDFSEITVEAGSTTAEFDYSISDKQLSFATEDSAIATVSANGSLVAVTGVSVGNTYLNIIISGISANGQQAFIKIPLTVN